MVRVRNIVLRLGKNGLRFVLGLGLGLGLGVSIRPKVRANLLQW